MPIFDILCLQKVPKAQNLSLNQPLIFTTIWQNFTFIETYWVKLSTVLGRTHRPMPSKSWEIVKPALHNSVKLLDISHFLLWILSCQKCIDNVKKIMLYYQWSTQMFGHISGRITAMTLLVSPTEKSNFWKSNYQKTQNWKEFLIWNQHWSNGPLDKWLH